MTFEGKVWRSRLVLFLAVVGPGFITANVDNDAGGIWTYSVAGVASSLELFGVPRYIVVPAAALLVWVMVVKGTYQSLEKLFLAASAFYVCYIIAGLLAHPDWKTAAVATISRPKAIGIRDYGY